MKIKSWHLALLGLALFLVHLASDNIVNDIKCNGNYEIGATDCHNEFESLSMILIFAGICVFAFPVVLMGIERGVKKISVAKWWIVTVFCLGIGSVLSMTLKTIAFLHMDGIIDFLFGVITWLSWQMLYISPLILAGLIVIFLLNRWRQTLGACISILIGGVFLVTLVSGSSSSSLTDVGFSVYWQFINVIALLLFSLSYLSAGLFYFLKERKTDEVTNV